MSKINDPDLLLQMQKEGASRTDMAARFQCSEVAICKKLAKLTASPAEPVEPLKIDALTSKEKSFVVAVVSGESQTSAACKAYDVSSRGSGKSLGHTLMGNQNIKEALAEIRDREIPLSHLINRLRKHVDSKDPATSLRAVDMGLKLHDAYPANKNVNVNVDAQPSFIDLSRWSNVMQKYSRDNTSTPGGDDVGQDEQGCESTPRDRGMDA